jgi:hypothetical protein
MGFDVNPEFEFRRDGPADGDADMGTGPPAVPVVTDVGD